MQIKENARQINELLGCRGFSRVDFILDEVTERLEILELNTTPGLSRNGNFVIATAALGLSYNDTILAMLRSCLWSK